VRLFPVIVSVIGLALTAYWFSLAVRAKKIQPLAHSEVFTANGIPVFLCLGLLVVYALLVPAAGFIVASAVFFLFVMFVSQRRQKSAISNKLQ
jgi:hypothetical protein